MSARADTTDSVTGLLSVVIPVGAVDEWLTESVESALAQTGVDLEVVAVFNNGAEVPEDWSPLNDPRVRVLYFPEPLGSGGAGQAGIDAARGEFFVRLDADDRMKPGRLKAQFDWLQEHPETVLVSSQVDWIDGVGQVTGSFKLPSGEDIRMSLLSLNVCPHSSWMGRMSTVRDVGGYDLNQHQMDDYDLLMRLGARGKVAILPKTLTEYRLHSGQMSRAVKPWGSYIRVITKRRRALGRAIGASGLQVAKARFWWETQQWMMYIGRKLRR